MLSEHIRIMMTIGMEAPCSKEAGFQISCTVWCFWRSCCARNTWFVCTRLPPSELRQKARYTILLIPILTTHNREFGCVFEGSLKKCYSGLASIATVEMFWKTWRSRTKCHFQSVMI